MDYKDSVQKAIDSIKSDIHTSKAEPDDLSELLSVENAAWPATEDDNGAIVASEEKFRHRIKIGSILKAEYTGEPITWDGIQLTEGTILGMISFQMLQMPIDFQDVIKKSERGVEWGELISMGFPKDWYELTDDGFLYKTHIPNGNVGCLVGVGVLPSMRGFGVVNNLIGGVVSDMKKSGLEWAIGYGRVPEYGKHPEVPLQQYVKRKRSDGKPVDYGLRFHYNNGAHIVCGIPQSMRPKDDWESLGNGALVVYQLK
ncbi:MAG: hypothetical protein HY362_00210 [Candidatus Aenigmarchaeota archaeon]|nr:hypothetical protein [Candidatus Aenigmarchaeota archaeon]